MRRGTGAGVAYGVLGAMLAVAGCGRRYVAPEVPMPPDTVLLSQMMRELSAEPGFTQAMLKEMGGRSEKGEKEGSTLLTPQLFNELRSLMLGGKWQALDRFPGWTMREITPTVRVVDRFAGKSTKLEDTAAVHPGSPASAAQRGAYLDVGPYALGRAETVSMDGPPGFAPFDAAGQVTQLGYGVVRGDGPNALAGEHAQSQRLADVLDRLAANGLSGTREFVATVHGRRAASPEALIAALAAAGSAVSVDDARYFANFGHLHWKTRGGDQNVMMPFWLDTKMVIPHAGGRHLLLPAAHAELEWHVHGAGFDADVSYYFGVDGKSEWRTMDTLDQPWVLGRNAHAYAGAEAVEATRLAGLLTVAYMHLHEAWPGLPFGGYYTLGVCQDGISAVEKKMTGGVTLFPNTADDAYFRDPRDAEVNAMIAAIPKDRDGAAPGPERVFGSVPTVPVGTATGAFNAVTVPGLAADLNATYAAWKGGELEAAHRRLVIALLAVGAVMMLGIWMRWVRRRDLRGVA